MLIDFLQGMLLGFTAAVPMGPINLLMMNESLKSYFNGVAVGMGAMSADVSYLLLILFGLSYHLNNEFVLNILSVFGAFFLFFIAYVIYKNRNKPIKKVDIDKKGSWFRHYIKGYVLTIFSPYTMVFWLSVATLSLRTNHPAFIVCGMLFAIFIWITAMPYFVYRTKHLISQMIYSKIALISAFAFVVFAVWMLVRLFL